MLQDELKDLTLCHVNFEEDTFNGVVLGETRFGIIRRTELPLLILFYLRFFRSLFQPLRCPRK